MMTNKTIKFVEKASAIHGGKYDYSKFVYVDCNTKSIIICPIHGEFLQSSKLHILRKNGCKECGKIKPKRKLISFNDWQARARAIHGDRYDYLNCGYTTNGQPVTITCPRHGPFTMPFAYQHTTNKGRCPQCASRQDTAHFIKKSTTIHGDFYSYVDTTYETCHTPVTITCPKHGIQHITPTDHYRVGCWICKRNRMQDVWLDEIGIPNTKSSRQVRLQINNKLHVVDGYDANTNTVYLFHGDFWHGNPKLYVASDINNRNMKTFGELYVATVDYENRLWDAGYNVICVWEYEWLQQKNVLSAKES